MRKAIAALVVAALAFGGWWIYASWLMRERATQLSQAVGSEILVVTRDVRGLPEESDVRAAIEARARDLGAEVIDLRVEQNEIDARRRPEALDMGTNQLQKILDRMQKGRVGMSPTRMHPLTIQPQMTIVAQKYAVHGEIVVSYGLWSYREPLDVEKVLQRQLSQ